MSYLDLSLRSSAAWDPGLQRVSGSTSPRHRMTTLPKSFSASSAAELWELSSYCQHRPELEGPVRPG